MPNTHSQPLPRGGAEDVTPQVITDLRERTRRGIQTYGRPLQTHNGRNALQDAYEEALDLAQYLKQALLERTPPEPRGEVAKFRWVQIECPVACYACRTLLFGEKDKPVTAILEEGPGPLAFFCSLDCGNFKEGDVAEVGQAAVSAPNPVVEDHKDGGAWRRTSNGGYSTILRRCSDCGQGYDPTWRTSREGCPGPLSEPLKEESAPTPAPNFHPRNHYPICKGCKQQYLPGSKSACDAGVCGGN